MSNTVIERVRDWYHHCPLVSILGIGLLVGNQLFFDRARLRSGDLRFILLFLLFAVLVGILVPLINYLITRFAIASTPRFSSARVGVGLAFALLILVVMFFMDYSDNKLGSHITGNLFVSITWFLLFAGSSPGKKRIHVTTSPKA